MKTRGWLVACVLLVIGFAGMCTYAIAAKSFDIAGTRYYVLFDDEMISMTHARNLAVGYGLVWSPGDRVQGITNLGWTLVMFVVHLVNIPPNLTSLVMQIINTLIASACGVLVMRFLWKNASPALALLGGLVLFVNFPFLKWTVDGTEAISAALWMTVATILLLGAETRPDRLAWLPVVGALAFLNRADGLLVFGILAVVTLAWTRKQDSAARRNGAIALTISTAVVLSVFVFQKTFYGEWFPNTVLLKASSDTFNLARGFDYVRDYLMEDGQLSIFALAALYFVFRAASRKLTAYELTAGAILVIWILYVIQVGGDAFPTGRFLVLLVPSLIIFAALAIQAMSQMSKVAGPAFAALLAFPMLGLFSEWPGYAMPYDTPRSAIIASKAIADRAEPEDVTAVIWAGMHPYFMPHFRHHDLLGKCDRVIAKTAAKGVRPGHNKWDYDYSLGVVQPRFVLAPFLGQVKTPESELRIAKENLEVRHYYAALLEHPIFRSRYRQIEVDYRGDKPEAVGVYERLP